MQYIGGKFLNIGFFSSTYKPVKKQETLKFFNKSCKVSIDLIIPEQKSIPTQKQWNFAWGEKTKTRLIHVESRAWSCCKQMNFLLFNMVEMIITKSCFFLDGRRSCPILMSISRTSEIQCLSVEKLSCLTVFTMSYLLRIISRYLIDVLS